MSDRYRVNEIFYSLQGEGGRAGEPSVFVRFSGCNLSCSVVPGPKSPGGFDCDTEFESGTWMTAKEIRAAYERRLRDAGVTVQGWPFVVFTGGEPLLQLDAALMAEFLTIPAALETNGSIALPTGVTLDWICVSPKVAEHVVRVERAHEVKYVRAEGQGIPKPKCKSTLKFVSPSFGSDGLATATLRWCVDLCLQNPPWRLSVQQHKGWHVR